MKIKFYSSIFNFIIKSLRFGLKLKSKKIEVDGYKISYLSRVKKDAKNLIFLHGLNDEKDTWLSLIKELGDDYNIIAIDLLGCGESDKPTEFDYSLASQADFTRKIIDAITKKENIKTFTLIGHSMGGGIALSIANSFNLEKLILLAPLSLNTKEPYIQKLAKELGSIEKVPFLRVCSKERLNELIDILYEKKQKIPNFIKEVIVNRKCKLADFEEKKIMALVDKEKMEFKDDLTDIAKEIKASTLILWGEKDRVLDVANAEALGDLIPNSEIKILNCGHMLQSEESKEVSHSIKNLT